MEELVYYTQKLVDGLKPLADLIPGRGILNYFGKCFGRLIEPYLKRHELIQDAKTQEKLFTDYPINRINQCCEWIRENHSMIPNVSVEAFENVIKIGQYALAYTNGDKENARKVESLPDDEWMNRFIDNAKYVSDENLQEFWGRLLKEKLFDPFNVNKRVLNIISNLDAQELKTIQKYMSCFLDEAIPTQVMTNTDFGLEMLVELQNLGLVGLINSPNPFQVIEKIYNIDIKNDTLYSKGYKFVFSGIVEPFEMSVPSYFLTKEGIVVYNLIEEPMREDMVSLYKTLFENSCKDKAVLTIEKINS